MSRHAVQDIRHAVGLCLRYWPNAHLGSYTAREDIRSAFLRIRRDVRQGSSLGEAIGRLEGDAYRHANM